MPDSTTIFEKRRIAMLIDGDNAQPSLMGEILAEASKYGLVSIRRIYGDWTTPNMNSWKEILNVYSVQPIQQFRYTTGKNATDSALIIEAMDILYNETVQGFCLVASDSDYTKLAMRIRESGIFVMGIGKKGTPKPFVNACEVFVYTENLVTELSSKDNKAAKIIKVSESASSDSLELLKNAVEKSLQDDGWANLGSVGNMLRQLDPSFDPRTYGKKQLSELFRQREDVFQINESKSKKGPSSIYVKLREESG